MKKPKKTHKENPNRTSVGQFGEKNLNGNYSTETF